MSQPRIVILGAGVAGHTAAAFLKKWLGRQADVIVVSPRPDDNWIPSNIWVGIGLLKPAQVACPLQPVYARKDITFLQARAVSLHDMIRGAKEPTHTASMAEMGAACVASAGANPFRGTAASITVFPIIPDFERYPEYGRDRDHTFGEIGLAGHWIKLLLHHRVLHKARMRAFWSVIPE